MPLIALLDNDAHTTTKTSINFFQTFEMQLKINRKIYTSVSKYTCFTTCVRYPGATGRCYLMRGTLLTVFTRG